MRFVDTTIYCIRQATGARGGDIANTIKCSACLRYRYTMTDKPSLPRIGEHRGGDGAGDFDGMDRKRPT